MLFANINPIDRTILINDIIGEIQQNDDEDFEFLKSCISKDNEIEYYRKYSKIKDFIDVIYFLNANNIDYRDLEGYNNSVNLELEKLYFDLYKMSIYSIYSQIAK